MLTWVCAEWEPIKSGDYIEFNFSLLAPLLAGMSWVLLLELKLNAYKPVVPLGKTLGNTP